MPILAPVESPLEAGADAMAAEGAAGLFVVEVTEATVVDPGAVLVGFAASCDDF